LSEIVQVNVMTILLPSNHYNVSLQMFTVGDFDTVEGINEASSLPEEVLQAYPAITTWNKLLGGEGLSH
jgi:hypothetical protein